MAHNRDLGDIELLFGTAEMGAAMALLEIRKRSWPEQVICLAEGVLSDSLPGYLSSKEKQTVGLLRRLANILQPLSDELKILSRTGDSEGVRQYASSLVEELYCNMGTVCRAPKNVAVDTIDSLKHVLATVRFLNAKVPNLDAHQVLAQAEIGIASVRPDEQAELVDLLVNLEETIRTALDDILDPFKHISKLNLKGEYSPTVCE